MGFNTKTVFLIIIVSLGFLNCDFLNTDEPNDTPKNNNYYLISTQTIGPNGGEINLDSLIITVPNGAFTENNDISIYANHSDPDFTDYSNTSSYQIDGIPENINKSIQFKLRHSGEIIGDTLLAVGQLTNITGQDSMITTYRTIEVSDSSGYLVYDLPAFISLGKSYDKENSDNRSFWLSGLGYYKKALSRNGHFSISIPENYFNLISLVGDSFEAAYDTCLNMGFTYFVREWPVEVVIKPLAPGFKGYYAYAGDTNLTDQKIRDKINNGRFGLNNNLLTDSEELSVVAGHEFLHLVQNLYEFSSPEVVPEQDWLREATSTWIMEKYSDNTNYIPSVLNFRETYIFAGWQFSNHTHEEMIFRRAEQGYGMCTLIKDLALTHGDNIIVDIYNDIKDGIVPQQPTSPISAILNNLNEPIREYWHRVIGSYVLGHYYNSNVNFRFLDDPNRYFTLFPNQPKFLLESEQVDTNNRLSTVNHTMQDFSAVLVKVQFGDLSSLTSVPINISVNDPTHCGLMVCKYKKGSEISVIEEVFPGNGGYVSILDIKPYIDNGYEIIALISNSDYNSDNNYEGTNEVELTIELPETPQYTDGSIFLAWPYEDWVKNWYSGNSKSWTDSMGYNSKVKYEIINMWSGTATSSMAGTTFKQDWDTESSQGHVVGSIVAEFNETFDTVLEYTEKYFLDEGGGWTVDIELKAENVPRTYSGVYRIEGEEVCDFLTTYTRKSTTSLSQGNVVSYRCSDKTILELEFK